MRKLVLILGLVFLLTSCMNKEATFEPRGNDSLELTKLRSEGITDQQPANQAKEFLSHYEEVAAVRAVNQDSQLVIAVEIKHLDRFSLEDIEKQLQKDIKKNFSDMKVTLSTDQKILIELRKLEEEITANRISHEEIKERLQKIKKLSQEET